MRKLSAVLSGLILLCLPFSPVAQSAWPREISLDKGKVILYQPQTDSMKGDHLYSRMAVSITTAKNPTPVFGAVWSDARFSTDRTTGTCTIFDVKIMNVRFPGIDTIDPRRVENFKSILAKEAVTWQIEFSLDELKTSLSYSQAASDAAANFKNDPPEIIYLKQPSFLVVFDGDPVWKETGKESPKRAVNTPFLVFQDTRENSCYLYGGSIWYKASDPVKSQWSYVQKPSAQVQKYFDALKKEMDQSKKTGQQPAAKSGSEKSAPLVVVVSTKPAELIQSKGEPQFAPIQETQLLYMTNTEDNIFMTIDKNEYFVLLSGRWFSSTALSGPWKYVASDKLPPDFAKIPEGSPKDVVLANVAGTDAAKEAVLDAQIPQTAAVDRKTAKCEVKWDGDPKFEKIKGTDLARGMNTASTVLLFNQTYFVCDNAVWFTGKSPAGPWVVATSIPVEIQKIPPDNPAYNVKYVYIYDVEPEVVYVGYTPGYTCCYVYGPTVVYGTGYPYPPFYGPHYYPMPVTFGFSMHYNPWYGFSMGFTVSSGMFSFSIGGPVGYPGGFWGPPMYRPPYAVPYNHYYGARPPAYRGGGNTININNNYNFYNNRPDRSARPSQQPAISTRPAGGERQGNRQTSGQLGTKPATRDVKPSNRTGGQNNVFTDRNGDVYRNNNGDWQRNNGKDWESARSSTPQQGKATRNENRGFNQQEMNRQNQARERGSQNNLNRSNAQKSMSGGARSGGGRSGMGGRRK